MEQAYAAAEHARALQTSTSFLGGAASGGGATPRTRSLLRDMLNISPILTDGAAAIIDDSFNKCFTMLTPDPWNWNAYLWPEWAMGVLLRHVILFPLRLVVLLICNVLFIGMFFVIGALYKPGPRRRQLELVAIQVRTSWVRERERERERIALLGRGTTPTPWRPLRRASVRRSSYGRGTCVPRVPVGHPPTERSVPACCCCCSRPVWRRS